MNSYLLTWNPLSYGWENLSDIITIIHKDSYYDNFGWSCGRKKFLMNGSRLFLIRLGVEPKGIIGSGYAIPMLGTSNTENVVYQDVHWNQENDDAANYINVLWDTLLNPESEDILSLDILKEHFPNQMWTPQMSGISIKEEIISDLENKWKEFVGNKISKIYLYPEEIENNEILYEGESKQILVNSYERNKLARKVCIEKYGYYCSVCNFNFEDIFGEIGKKFIHVHHLVRISEIGKNYKIDPINDLRPVCANCHAMLHKKEPPFTICELKEKLK